MKKRTLSFVIAFVVVSTLVATGFLSHFLASPTTLYKINYLQANPEILAELFQPSFISMVHLDADESPVADEAPATANPIDSFFDEIWYEVDFNQNTLSMVVHGVLLRIAWEAEMKNFHNLLLARTENDFVRETLENEILHFVEYSQHRTEIYAIIAGTDAFADYHDSDAELFYGSISRVVRQAELSHGYREKALTLLDRLQMLDGLQLSVHDDAYYTYFSFNPEDFHEWMLEEYDWLWID